MTAKPDCAWLLSDLDAVSKNGIKVMSTFACGGGSTMGYKLAGCDVIVKRWQDFTGKQAVLESDGRAFAEAINNDYQKKSRKAGGKTV